jgi:hypothetical protein
MSNRRTPNIEHRTGASGQALGMEGGIYSAYKNIHNKMIFSSLGCFFVGGINSVLHPIPMLSRKPGAAPPFDIRYSVFVIRYSPYSIFTNRCVHCRPSSKRTSSTYRPLDNSSGKRMVAGCSGLSARLLNTTRP